MHQIGSQARALGSLRDIDQILYGPDGGAIWALHHHEASELSVFRAEESPSLLRTIRVGFEARAWRTAPDCGIVITVDKWPNLIIDPNTGMSLASYFQTSEGMTTTPGFTFRDEDESLLQRIDKTDVGVREENAKDERLTGYRWSPDIEAPVLLSWDELGEVWGEER